MTNRRSNTIAGIGSLVALMALAPSSALAQDFPADSEWVALSCAGMPSWDPVRDEPGANGERDAVGDADAPATYVFADDSFVYYRMRVDGDPGVGTDFRPFGWGVEMDIDGSRDSYEVLTIVDGISNPDEVQLHQNTNQRTPGDPTDPPEVLVGSFAAPPHARAVLAEGPFASSFSGDPDYFVDWAVPVADMESVGVLDTTTLAMVFGTSSSTSGLDADIVCHNGADGAPTLSGSSTDPVERDGGAVMDSDGDGLADDEEIVIGTNPDLADSDDDGWSDGDEIREGTDPLDPDSFPEEPDPDPDPDYALRGGGGPTGCAVAARPDAGLWLVLALVGLAWRRRR